MAAPARPSLSRVAAWHHASRLCARAASSPFRRRRRRPQQGFQQASGARLLPSALCHTISFGFQAQVAGRRLQFWAELAPIRVGGRVPLSSLLSLWKRRNVGSYSVHSTLRTATGSFFARRWAASAQAPNGFEGVFGRPLGVSVRGRLSSADCGGERGRTHCAGGASSPAPVSGSASGRSSSAGNGDGCSGWDCYVRARSRLAPTSGHTPPAPALPPTSLRSRGPGGWTQFGGGRRADVHPT